MEEKRLEMLKQLAAGIAAQFGSNCEVVIHDVSSNHPDHSIVHIENGHVSGRKVGDGASQVVLDQMASQAEHPQDHLCYLTRTPDGKILKSSTLYIRNRRGAVTAIFSINYDVSGLMMIQSTIGDLLSTQDKERVPGDQVQRQSGKILRYFQIHSLFLHRRKQRRRQINQEERKHDRSDHQQDRPGAQYPEG